MPLTPWTQWPALMQTLGYGVGLGNVCSPGLRRLGCGLGDLGWRLVGLVTENQHDERKGKLKRVNLFKRHEP